MSGDRLQGQCQHGRCDTRASGGGFVRSVAQTVNMNPIQRHDHRSHRHLDPSGIVPKGPRLDFLSGDLS